MRVKLKSLKPNPFKKYINGGKFNQGKVELLKESIEKSGFWDNVICRKSNGEYQLAYGHHRVEAARRVLGNDYVADLPVKNLTDEDMVRILANENNMQNEEYAIYQVDTVVMTRKWLENRPDGGRFKGTHKDEVGARQISEFLGERNWGKSKVAEYLRTSRDLHPKIMSEMKNVPNTGGKSTQDFTVSHASRIARIPDKKKQLEVAKYVKREGLNTRETENVVSNLLGGKVIREEKRRVDKSRITNVIKNLEGQEIALTCKTLISLIKKYELGDFEIKEQALLGAIYKDLLTILQNQVGV